MHLNTNQDFKALRSCRTKWVLAPGHKCNLETVRLMDTLHLHQDLKSERIPNILVYFYCNVTHLFQIDIPRNGACVRSRNFSGLDKRICKNCNNMEKFLTVLIVHRWYIRHPLKTSISVSSKFKYVVTCSLGKCSLQILLLQLLL